MQTNCIGHPTTFQQNAEDHLFPVLTLENAVRTPKGFCLKAHARPRFGLASLRLAAPKSDAGGLVASKRSEDGSIAKTGPTFGYRPISNFYRNAVWQFRVCSYQRWYLPAKQ
jgi:hypothetical protein